MNTINDDRISDFQELKIKLEAEKKIKLIELEKNFATFKDDLAEKYNISLAAIHAKESEELVRIENDFQNEIAEIELKFN
ncbi:MAG: hypothetical protein LBV48_02275 [Mycoplasmataceae bacterium]|jgi:hypothetical protein|nr:hypothetical protein [Mycoplasmataceae bacterium]